MSAINRSSQCELHEAGQSHAVIYTRHLSYSKASVLLAQQTAEPDLSGVNVASYAVDEVNEVSEGHDSIPEARGYP